MSSRPVLFQYSWVLKSSGVAAGVRVEKKHKTEKTRPASIFFRWESTKAMDVPPVDRIRKCEMLFSDNLARMERRGKSDDTEFDVVLLRQLVRYITLMSKQKACQRRFCFFYMCSILL